MSIIELHSEYLAILTEIENTGGEMTETHESRIESIGREISQKADKADFVLRKLDSESEFVAAEIKRLQAFKRAIDNANETLVKFIKHQMLSTGQDRIHGELVDLVISKSKPKVVVEDEGLIPDGYFFEKIERVLSKNRLAEDLKLGSVNGARLEDVYALKVTRSRN